MDEIRERYQKVFEDVFGPAAGTPHSEFVFGENGWDSVVHMSLITELKDEFGIMFDTDDILHYGSYQNGLRLLEKYEIR